MTKHFHMVVVKRDNIVVNFLSTLLKAPLSANDHFVEAHLEGRDLREGGDLVLVHVDAHSGPVDDDDVVVVDGHRRSTGNRRPDAQRRREHLVLEFLS